MGAREDAERFFARTDVWVNLVTLQEAAARMKVSATLVSKWKALYRDFPPMMKPVRADRAVGWYWYPDLLEFRKRHPEIGSRSGRLWQVTGGSS